MLVEHIEGGLTLADAAEDFLAALLPEERGKIQSEVLRFVRWLGPSRQVKEISPLEVASYGEQISPSAVKPLRSFLSYVRKEGFTEISLAAHLRAKKTPTKPIAVWQSSQHEQVTLTAEGYAKLEEELASLKSQRSQVIEEMQKAAADKDFRENAPLAAAREQKSHLDGRIKEIESILNQARTIGKEQHARTAQLGYTVLLRDLSSDKALTYTLVDPREANPAKGKLSVASPLGKAILDRQVGEPVEVFAPGGIFRCRIESIAPPSAEAQTGTQSEGALT